MGQVLNSALNSVTKVLWHPFVPHLAGAQADMPCCCFSTSTCAWQNSTLRRFSREDSCPGMGCCVAASSFIIPVTLGKVKCTAGNCYRLEEDAAQLQFTSSSFELNKLSPLLWLCVCPWTSFSGKKNAAIRPEQQDLRSWRKLFQSGEAVWCARTGLRLRFSLGTDTMRQHKYGK